MTKITIDELKSHQFALFTKSGGIAVDQEKNSLITLSKNGMRWEIEKVVLTSIRDVTNIKEEYTAPHHLPSRAQGAGARIGAGISDDLRRRKAKKSTGIDISLKSIEKPKIFVNLPDDTARSRCFEALSLALEGALGQQRFQDIPNWVRDMLSGSDSGLIGAKLHSNEDPAKKYLPKPKEKKDTPPPSPLKMLLIAAVGLVVCLVLALILSGATLNI